ncbi:AAA domain-containing protein [Kineococcus sp. SYSU DK002]|uniref:AAA domain-containing protein n=1 Tax=Kineococcus sp. SYSU DK002 TaxID=3383123 RepID=UPI003D7E0D1D
MKLLDFLSEYDAQRHPAVLDIAQEGLYRVVEGQLPAVPGITFDPAEQHWLRVDYVELPAAPTPPASVRDVLSGPLTAVHRPELIPEPEHPGAEADPEEIARWDDMRRQRERAEQWIDTRWQPWSEAYAAAQQAKKAYRDLFEAAERLHTDRDSVELVWGFGMLKWRLGTDTRISHPLLTIPVEVTTDPATQALSIHPDGAMELQTLPLAGVDLRDRAGLNVKRDALAQEVLEPWSDEVTEQLRATVRLLHEAGALQGEADHPAGAPVVDPSWVLYLRRRQRDYQGFLDNLRTLYQDGAAVPAALAALVAEEPSRVVGRALDGRQGTGSSRGSGATEPLLLPLPANEEQARILRLAQERPGVTVQGPPGTGKTHTIANLVSHYVAYGKRVLVVAEKEQALRRVAEKVPDGIRSLIVNVFGADEESRRELGAAITGIQAGVNGLDRDHADEEIARLTQALDDLDRRIATTTSEMLTTRVAETTTLSGEWPAGIDPTPQQVAQWLAAHSELGYVPDLVEPGTACPLTVSELGRLVELVDRIGVRRAEECAYALPLLTDLPTPAQLALALSRRAELEQQLTAAAPVLTDWNRVDAASVEQLEQARTLVDAEVEHLTAASAGWAATVSEQLTDPLLHEEWVQFATACTTHREQLMSLRTPLRGHDVTVPDTPASDLGTQLAKARDALAAKGKLGLFAGAAKRALETCTVDGHAPATAQEVELCEQALALQASRRSLTTRWRNQFGDVGGPELTSGSPEVECRGPLEVLGGLLGADERWGRMVEALGRLGVDVPVKASLHGATRLQEVVALFDTRAVERTLIAELSDAEELLRRSSEQEDASPLCALLLDAFRSGATERYGEVRELIADLAGVAPQALELRDLRARLSAAAPLWAQEVLADTSAARDVGDLPVAWQWRQCDTWIAKITAMPSPTELQVRLEELSAERRRIVTELVSQRAWRRLADNLGDRERKALNQYLQAVNRYGKTGGKFAARWLAEQRRSLNEAKTAVPVWVMTTSRALASFAAERTPPFDVLIIDEASQAGFEALPVFSLASTSIVVGDEKQTSPENVGLDRAQVFDLIDDHLSSIHGHRTLFDPDNSLYDMARLQFPDIVMLVEHFRCLPDIIGFSSALCYDNKIQPLRDQAPAPGWSALGAVRVLDGYRTGGRTTTVNRPEAEAVVDLIAELDADPRYTDMTFGVVTLLAGGQARLIDELLMDRLGPKRFNERRLRVGEAAAFQGDERDVIVISVVAALDSGTSKNRIAGAATSLRDQRRINVAASRAQQQMWVVHSADPESFPDGDYRAALIRHCRDPRGIEKAGEEALALCESPFETAVLQRILARGYRRVRAQHQVGSPTRNYRIDLVVEGPSSRLAVECDGERWHGPDRWHADRARQQVLERAGWTFERIRGSAFYRDPDSALEPLWARLAAMGIPTGSEWVDGDGPQPTVRSVSGATPPHAEAGASGERSL